MPEECIVLKQKLNIAASLAKPGYKLKMGVFIQVKVPTTCVGNQVSNLS